MREGPALSHLMVLVVFSFSWSFILKEVESLEMFSVFFSGHVLSFSAEHAVKKSQLHMFPSRFLRSWVVLQTFAWVQNFECFFHTVDGSEIRLTSWYGQYPIISGFYRSQVVVWDFFHQQYWKNLSCYLLWFASRALTYRYLTNVHQARFVVCRNGWRRKLYTLED